MSFNWDSFSMLNTLEKDIDKLYNVIEKKII